MNKLLLFGKALCVHSRKQLILKRVLPLGVLILFTTLASAQITQIGASIEGQAADDQLNTVALSSDGSILATAAPRTDSNGTYAGRVTIYELIGGVWSQMGGHIDGDSADDYSGEAIALSSNGKIVAVGATGNDGNGYGSGQVRIFEYVGGVWSQLGSDIDGEAASDAFGVAIDLSSDGMVVAVGAHLNDDGPGVSGGHVRVFEYSGGTWSQRGADIDGEGSGDNSGAELSISGDGNTVAIAARYNDGVNGANSGHVRVYQYAGGSWSQLGLDIDGEAATDYFGTSVSISKNGTRVAIGGWFNDGVNGANSGHARIFEYSGGSWSQLGADIDGEAAGDLFGCSISISDDGSYLAVGAYNNDNLARSNVGHIRVFEYDGSAWTQLYGDIESAGTGNNRRFSVDIALSGDGGTVAGGATGARPNGTNSGRIRAFEILVPKATISTTKPTCNLATHIPNVDGVLQLDTFINVTYTKYGYSIGSTYTGPDFATATTLGALPVIISSTETNPLTLLGQSYTVRLFEASGDFNDYGAMLPKNNSCKDVDFRLEMVTPTSGIDVNIGEVYVLTYKVSNIGVDASESGDFQFWTPTNSSLLVANPDGGSYDMVSNIWHIDNIGPSGSYNITFTLKRNN